MEVGDRTERLLAMILLHDMQDAPQGERAFALNRAGFSNQEIADLLGTTAAVIAQQLYAKRGATGRKESLTKRPRRKKRSGKRT